MLLRWWFLRGVLNSWLVIMVHVPEGILKVRTRQFSKAYWNVIRHCSLHFPQFAHFVHLTNKNVHKSLYQTFVSLFYYFFKAWIYPYSGFDLSSYLFGCWFVIWCSWSLFWSTETGCLRNPFQVEFRLLPDWASKAQLSRDVLVTTQTQCCLSLGTAASSGMGEGQWDLFIMTPQ